jgi:hypothetical protein
LRDAEGRPVIGRAAFGEDDVEIDESDDGEETDEDVF